MQERQRAKDAAEQQQQKKKVSAQSVGCMCTRQLLAMSSHTGVFMPAG